MRGALLLGQGKQIQFENQHDRVYDRLLSQQYQQKIPPIPKSQAIAKVEVNHLIAKKTISIKMVEGKD